MPCAPSMRLNDNSFCQRFKSEFALLRQLCKNRTKREDILSIIASIAAINEGCGIKKHLGECSAGSFYSSEVTDDIIAEDTCGGGPRHAHEGRRKQCSAVLLGP